MASDNSYFGKEFAGRVLIALTLFVMLVLVVESFLSALTLPALQPLQVLDSGTANRISLEYLWDDQYRAVDLLIQGLVLLAAALAVAAQFRPTKEDK